MIAIKNQKKSEKKVKIMWRHHQKFPRKVSSRKLLSLWNISFQMNNATQTNAANQKKDKKLQRVSLCFLRTSIDSTYDCYEIVWMEYLKVLVKNNLSVPKFECAHIFSTHLYRKLFEKSVQHLEFFYRDTLQ